MELSPGVHPGDTMPPSTRALKGRRNPVCCLQGPGRVRRGECQESRTGLTPWRGPLGDRSSVGGEAGMDAGEWSARRVGRTQPGATGPGASRCLGAKRPERSQEACVWFSGDEPGDVKMRHLTPSPTLSGWKAGEHGSIGMPSFRDGSARMGSPEGALESSPGCQPGDQWTLPPPSPERATGCSGSIRRRPTLDRSTPQFTDRSLRDADRPLRDGPTPPRPLRRCLAATRPEGSREAWVGILGLCPPTCSV